MKKKRSADGLFRRPNSKYWQCWINGERRSTGCTDRVAARSVKANLERLAADPKRHAAEMCDLQGAVDDFSEYLLNIEDKGAATRDFYTRKAKSLIRYFGGETKLAQLADAKIWQRFIADRAQQVGRNTIGHELTTAKRVLRVAKLNGAFPFDLDEVFPPRYSRKYTPRKRALSVEEIGKLLEALEATSPRLAGFVAWEIATASRLSEVARAEAQDVEHDGAVVRVRGTKTEAADTRIPIHPMFRPLIARALELGSKRGPLFGGWHNPSRDLEAACKRAGIAKCTTNDLRRTHAQLLNAEGVDLRAIAAVLRHTTTRMVEQVYAPTSLAVAAKMLTAADGMNLPKTAHPAAAGCVTPVSGDRIELSTRGFSIRSADELRRFSRLLTRLRRPIRLGRPATNSTLVFQYPPPHTVRIYRPSRPVVRCRGPLRIDRVGVAS